MKQIACNLCGRTFRSIAEDEEAQDIELCDDCYTFVKMYSLVKDLEVGNPHYLLKIIKYIEGKENE